MAMENLRFYLQGREDAAERFGDETEYDAEAIARSLSSWTEIAAAVKSTVTDDLAANDPELTGEAQDMLESLGFGDGDHDAAYEAWRHGYADELACILEAEVVNSLVEMADEIDTAVETPSAKSRTTKRNPAGDGPSYAAYFEDGIRDCENTFSADDFDPELRAAVEAFRKHRQDISKLAAQAVKDYWRENEAESKALWHRQNDETVRNDGLKPDRAYELWADGWRAQAQKYLAIEIAKRAAD